MKKVRTIGPITIWIDREFYQYVVGVKGKESSFYYTESFNCRTEQNEAREDATRTARAMAGPGHHAEES